MSAETPFGYNANDEPVLYGPGGWVTYYGDAAHHVTPARVAGEGEVVVSAADLARVAANPMALVTDAEGQEAVERLKDAALAAQSEPASDEPLIPKPALRHDEQAKWDTRTKRWIITPAAPTDQGEEPDDPYEVLSARLTNEAFEKHSEQVRKSREPFVKRSTPTPPADREQQRAATLPDTPHTKIRVQRKGDCDQTWDSETEPGVWYYAGTDSKVPEEKVARVQSFTILAEPPKGDGELAEEFRKGWKYGHQCALDEQPRQAGHAYVEITPDVSGFKAALDRMSASGQPDGDDLDAFIAEQAKNPHFMVAYIDTQARAYADRAVARIRAEGYLTVDTLVEALRDEVELMQRADPGGLIQHIEAFDALADRLAQSGQQHTEKEN